MSVLPLFAFGSSHHTFFFCGFSLARAQAEGTLVYIYARKDREKKNFAISQRGSSPRIAVLHQAKAGPHWQYLLMIHSCWGTDQHGYACEWLIHEV